MRTGHQEGLVYQNKSKVQLKGKADREGKGLENVVCCLEGNGAE